MYLFTVASYTTNPLLMSKYIGCGQDFSFCHNLHHLLSIMVYEQQIAFEYHSMIGGFDRTRARLIVNFTFQEYIMTKKMNLVLKHFILYRQ